MEKSINGNESENAQSQKLSKKSSSKIKNVSSNVVYRNDTILNDATLRASVMEFKKYVDELTDKINESNKKIEGLELDVKDLNEKNSVLEKRNEELNTKIEKNNILTQVQLKEIELYKNLLDQKNQELQNELMKTNTKLENMKRNHTLIISNLGPVETGAVHDFLNKSLDIKLLMADIESVSLVTNGKDITGLKDPKNYLVTFTCYRTKCFVYLKWLENRLPKKNLNNANKSLPSVLPRVGLGLCMKEYLSDSEQIIYDKAIECLNAKKFQDVWTKFGVTYVYKDGNIQEASEELMRDKSIFTYIKSYLYQ